MKIKNSSKRKTWYSQLIQILITIVVITWIICAFLSKSIIQIGFFCKDPKLSFPYHGDTIQFSLLIVVTLIGTLPLILSVEYGTKNNNWFQFVKKWYLEYLIGLLINTFIVVFIKTIVSAPRPHFFESCLPDTIQNCLLGEYITSYECTNTNISKTIIRDSQQSFPSGHTSLIVYTSLFCVWYTYYRYRNVQIKKIIIYSILIGCIICAITRITDNRHHWWDVVVGTMLGLGSATFQVFLKCKQFETIKTII